MKTYKVQVALLSGNPNLEVHYTAYTKAVSPRKALCNVLYRYGISFYDNRLCYNVEEV